MKLLDLKGKTFGKLTVLYREKNRIKQTVWMCKCLCGKTLIVRANHLVTGRSQSCGCTNSVNLTERYKTFWDKLIPTKQSCWEYRGSNVKGYGAFGIGMKTFRTHRLAYQYQFGEIPKGMHVLHSCDNPSCCYPGHLRLGTQKENIQDCIDRGRTNFHKFGIGEKHPRSKLTDDIVLKIFNSKETTSVLAKEHDVSGSTIKRIRNGSRSLGKYAD